MAEITVRCKNYSGSYHQINGDHTRRVSKLSFIRAIITVGAQKYSDILNFGWRGLFHRYGMGIAALSFLERRGSHLCLSASYSSLDMSEKAAATYWYGMAFTKLVAESELYIPWLGHVDSLKKNDVLQTTSGSKSRGDLAGRDLLGSWHVLEAKGRSQGFSNQLVIDAKKQASYVTSIKGNLPSTTSASITRLDTIPISVLLDDPHDGKASGRWEIDEKQFFREYYRTITKYLQLYRRDDIEMHQGVKFVIAPLYLDPLLNFKQQSFLVGLPKQIFDKPEIAPSVMAEFAKLSEKKKNEKNLNNMDQDIGADGLLVAGYNTAWEESK